MNILDQIVTHKQQEVAANKLKMPEHELKASILFPRHCISLVQHLQEPTATGIIAEFKRKSPSKGFINERADAATISNAYVQFGASGLSVLTDQEFFGGAPEDLAAARQNNIPILRKDFMIDPYQILESKAMGADVILLIAACLSPKQVGELADVAKQTGMEVLLELHDESELGHVCEAVDMVGINNRNLKTFQVDINQSLKLGERISPGKIKIAESGIDQVQTLVTFREAGFKGFLMGEKFMKAPDPGVAFKNFVEAVSAG